jgi:predicted permease
MTQVFSIFSNIILPILIILTTGYVLQKLIKFDPAVFTKVIFYILAPCLIFSRLYKTVLSFREFALVVIFALTIIVILGILSYPVSLFRKFPPSMRPAFALSIMFYNSANYGLPVVELVFAQNPVATSIQIMILTVQNVINMTLGIFLVSKGQANFQRSLSRMLRYPMIYAIALALALRGFHIPVWQPIWTSLERISSALIPVALITLGANIARIRLNYRIFDVIISSVFRLMVAPLIAVLLLKLFHFSGIAARTLLISTSMPTAVNTALIALEFNNEPQFASQAVLFSTLLSIATVSFSIYGSVILFP